jgi:hypothetical protein
MKAHILFDDEGRVGAMSHNHIKKHGYIKKSAAGEHGGFLPGPGQHTAFLDIPEELAHLKPRDLHDSVRVELKAGTPRLVAKTK